MFLCLKSKVASNFQVMIWAICLKILCYNSYRFLYSYSFYVSVFVKKKNVQLLYLLFENAHLSKSQGRHSGIVKNMVEFTYRVIYKF